MSKILATLGRKVNKKDLEEARRMAEDIVSWVASCPIHTADADATQLSSRVGGVNAPVGSHDPVFCRWPIEVGNEWWLNDVIVQKVITIDSDGQKLTLKELTFS